MINKIPKWWLPLEKSRVKGRHLLFTLYLFEMLFFYLVHVMVFCFCFLVLNIWKCIFRKQEQRNRKYGLRHDMEVGTETSVKNLKPGRTRLCISARKILSTDWGKLRGNWFCMGLKSGTNFSHGKLKSQACATYRCDISLYIIHEKPKKRN